MQFKLQRLCPRLAIGFWSEITWSSLLIHLTFVYRQTILNRNWKVIILSSTLKCWLHLLVNNIFQIILGSKNLNYVSVLLWTYFFLHKSNLFTRKNLRNHNVWISIKILEKKIKLRTVMGAKIKNQEQKNRLLYLKWYNSSNLHRSRLFVTTYQFSIMSK